MADRRQEAYAVRLEAAEMARSREHPQHTANGEEQRYAGAKYFMSFTKGLPHNPITGLLEDPQDFVEFRRAIDEAFIDPFTDRVRHGARYNWGRTTNCRRSPTLHCRQPEISASGKRPRPAWSSSWRAPMPRR